MRNAWSLILVACFPLACARLVDSDGLSAQGVARSSPDLAAPDSAPDVARPAPDVALPAPDAALPDVASPAPDGAPPAPDAEPPAPDMAAPSPDLALDGPAGLPPPCRGPLVFGYPGTPMVICEYSPSLSQCLAMLGCNYLEGWHVCTASEYLANGGNTRAAPYAGWIRSCIRNSAFGTNAPNDSVCSCSGPETVTSVEAGWPCSGAGTPTTSDQRYLGVVSHSSCQRVGIDATTSEAYWAPRPIYSSTNYVVCCPD